jgi:hypothetical protein
MNLLGVTIMKKLFFLSLTVLFYNCTGLNLGADLYGFANTNPTPGYTNELGSRLHGGFFYHSNSIPGQLGNADSEKKGTSCQMAILYIASFGDSSILAAKKNAKITKIGSIDYTQTGILGGYLYHSFCTNVYGTTESVPVQTNIEVTPEPVKPAPTKKGR